MPPSDPAETLRKNRKRATSLAERAGAERTRKLLEKAQKSLEERLLQAEGLRGPGEGSFTAVQLRTTIEQVRDVLRHLKGGLHSTILDAAKIAAEQSAQGTLTYLAEQEQNFRGISEQPLALDQAAILDQAVRGTESSILTRISSDPGDARGGRILDRYGTAVIESFEEDLRMRFVTREPWAVARQRLIDSSTFLQGKPMFWAERILRTEVMFANNAANFSTLQQADQTFGDMVKILSATFDDRTGADSIAVHGQIRRTAEPFDTWYGRFMHPPDRPNDRDIVVPQRISWPLPASLAPRSAGEVMARWVKEGRKGPHPAIPSRSTVPIEQFGKPSAPPVQDAPVVVPDAVKKGGYAENYTSVAKGVSDHELDYMRDPTSFRDDSFRAVGRVYDDHAAKGKSATEIATRVLDPILIDIEADGSKSLRDGRHRWTTAKSKGASAIRAQVRQYGPRGGVKWVQVMDVPIR